MDIFEEPSVGWIFYLYVEKKDKGSEVLIQVVKYKQIAYRRKSNDLMRVKNFYTKIILRTYSNILFIFISLCFILREPYNELNTIDCHLRYDLEQFVT